MNIKRLRYFCTVVECGSVSKAAQVLHLSQPPLSKRLQELEAETGVPLLARQGNKIAPTASLRNTRATWTNIFGGVLKCMLPQTNP